MFEYITNKIINTKSQFRLFMSSAGLRVFRSEDEDLVYAEGATLADCLIIADHDCNNHLSYEQAYLNDDAPYDHVKFGSDLLLPIDKLLTYGTIIIKAEGTIINAYSAADQSFRVSAENFDDIIIKLDQICKNRL